MLIQLPNDCSCLPCRSLDYSLVLPSFSQNTFANYDCLCILWITEYLTNLNWLFLSGFLMSMTIERWDLHKRFSLKVLTWCGTSPKPLLLGIMFATYFISMFISNTATSLMMVVNGVSICASINENLDAAHKDESKRFGRAVMLGIAYAANLGGMSSLIGTGPNLAFARQLGILFPDAPEFTFADWWFFGLPTGLIFFFIVWFYLCMIYLRNFVSAGTIDKNLFVDQYAAMGPWTLEQRIVAALFAILSLGWVFRADLNFSSFVIKGWRNAFPEPGFITDTTLGMTIGFILFICPARVANLPVDNRFSIKPDETSDGKKIEAGKDRKAVKEADNWTTLLNWHVANQMPYDILFLLGGGFALAKAFVESGLSDFLGQKLAGMGVSVSTLLYIMIFFIIWLTELTSNTSTSNIMIPIAGSLARAMNVSPYTFMIPATMACSCAFFLPIATPPNMVVYSTGMIELREMNKAGVFLNILCSVLLWIAAYTIIPAVTGVPANDFPAWATALPVPSEDA